MDSSETHYVSFLNGEDDGLENGELHQRRGVRAGRPSPPFVVTTRTYFWKKFLRQRNFTARAWIALVAAAVSLLVFASFLIQWQGEDDRAVFPPSPVEDHQPPANIWEWKEAHFQDAFSSFQAMYAKSYATEEEKQRRYAIFKNNLVYIHTHNQQGYSYSLKMNHFGDLSRDEFRRKYLGFKKSRNLKSHHLGVSGLGLFSISRATEMVSALYGPKRSRKEMVDSVSAGVVAGKSFPDISALVEAWTRRREGDVDSLEKKMAVKLGVQPVAEVATGSNSWSPTSYD